MRLLSLKRRQPRKIRKAQKMLDFSLACGKSLPNHLNFWVILQKVYSPKTIRLQNYLINHSKLRKTFRRKILSNQSRRRNQRRVPLRNKNPSRQPRNLLNRKPRPRPKQKSFRAKLLLTLLISMEMNMADRIMVLVRKLCKVYENHTVITINRAA